MFRKLKNIFVGKKLCQSFFTRLFMVAIEGLNIGTGGRGIAENGGNFSVSYALKGVSSPVIFDVGAQGGDYIEEIIRVTKISNAHASIHAFEPCLRDYEPLKEKFKSDIFLNNIALGDHDGESLLYYPRDIRGVSSLHKSIHDTSMISEKVVIRTIDSFCKENKIREITFLKLDVEGNELSCLKGAKDTLRNIKFIQFEISLANINSRTYFRDIFELLVDYKIYRILRDGLAEIPQPDRLSEMLFTTNYLAERKT